LILHWNLGHIYVGLCYIAHLQTVLRQCCWSEGEIKTLTFQPHPLHSILTCHHCCSMAVFDFRHQLPNSIRWLQLRFDFDQTATRPTFYSHSTAIAQFAITINSNVCPHIRIPNMLMRNPMHDIIGFLITKHAIKF